MLINHAVRTEDLENGGEEMLINHYLDILNQKLVLLKEDQAEGANQPDLRDIALWHYKLAVAYYFWFFLGRFWKTALSI